MNFSRIYLAIIAGLLFASCSNQPKEIAPIEAEPQPSNNMFEHNHQHENEQTTEDSWHTVVVKEVLQAEKYSYVLVGHGDGEMWIATLKATYNPGERYRMKTGLLKTNFKSIEHNRTFSELYLVSEIYPESASVTEANADEIEELHAEGTKPDGVTAIADIVKNPKDYAGKKVRIYGKVVKANPNIMNRNWLHIDDGSAPEYDFVLTTQSEIPVGHEIAFDGTIAINRDFGAGYTYEVIMEDAKPLR